MLINFDNWEEYDEYDEFEILNEFFYQKEFSKCYSFNNLYYLNSLFINKNSVSYIEQYLINNNLNIKWRIGYDLIYGLKKYLNETDKINIVIGHDNKIYKILLYNYCYNIIDFRK